jgi:hypothetical protein
MESLEINERGYFWWSDQPIPEEAFAPPGGTYGLLTIDVKGRITLDLDGLLSAERFPRFDREKIVNRNISGILKRDNRRILLCNLNFNGGDFKTAGLSNEGFTAEFCLVGYDELSNLKEIKSFHHLGIDLSGFDEWISPGSIEVRRSKRSTTITHKSKKSLRFKLRDGFIEFQFRILGPSFSGSHRKEAKLREIIMANYRLKFNSLKMAVDEYLKLEDLFIILTDCEGRLSWPTIHLNKESIGIKLYFQRWEREPKDIRFSHCWLRFPQVAKNFELLLDTWRDKREKLGPGIYMYLGLRRGLTLYSENSFANMIWGLEALHRTSIINHNNENLKKKITRILEQISRKNDKIWLERILCFSGEPNLENRLIDILSTLPLPIPKDRLQKFSNTCAKYRNDLSHFGASRGEATYDEFILKLHDISAALDILYHLKIIQEIGVSAELISWIFSDGFQSFRIKDSLWRVGLIVEDPRDAINAAARKAQKQISAISTAPQNVITNQPIRRAKKTRSRKKKDESSPPTS